MIKRTESGKSTESGNKTKDKYRQNRQTLFVLAFAVALVMTVPVVFTESDDRSDNGYALLLSESEEGELNPIIVYGKTVTVDSEKNIV